MRNIKWDFSVHLYKNTLQQPAAALLYPGKLFFRDIVQMNTAGTHGCTVSMDCNFLSKHAGNVLILMPDTI